MKFDAQGIAEARELLKDKVHHGEVSGKDLLAALDEIERLREALTELENKTGHTFYGGNGSDIVCLNQRGMIVCSGPKDEMLAHAEKHNLACARLIPIRFHALEGGAG